MVRGPLNGDDVFDRQSEVVERYRIAIAPCRHDGRFVDQVGEVGTSEARARHLNSNEEV